MKKEDELSEELKKKIEKNVAYLMDTGSSDVTLKAVLCDGFYVGHSSCVDCSQTSEDLLFCKKEYLKWIVINPMHKVCAEFYKPRQRDTIQLETALGVGLVCDSCHMEKDCPFVESGCTCKIDWGSNVPTTTAQFFDYMLKIQTIRVRRALKFEEIDGGIPDQNASSEMDRLSGLVRLKADAESDKVKLTFEAKSGAPNNTSGESILAKFFGGALKPKEQPALPEKTEEIQAIDITEAQKEKIRAKKNNKKEKN